MTVLERLRRRARSTSAALLPLLCCAWLDASAAACAEMLLGPAMAEARDAEAHHGGAHHGGAHHGGAHHGGAHDAGAHHAEAAHDAGAHRAEARDAAAHEADARDHAHDSKAHHAAARDGETGVSPHDHGTCPHCPVGASSGEPVSGHVYCDTTSSAVDLGRAVKAEPDPKQLLALIGLAAPPSLPRPERSAAATLAIPAPASGVPLTIRYCVYLI